MSKINPKTVLKMASRKKENKTEIKDIDLNKIDFTIDDLYLRKDKSNMQAYTALKNLLNEASTCQVSDAYNNLYRRNGVIKDLKPMNNRKAYGKIVTCNTDTDDWGTGMIGIDTAKKGEILFIKSTGEAASVWGELATTCAEEKGLAAVAIYGYLRDYDATKYMDFPLFAIDVCPNAGCALGQGQVNTNLEIDNAIIKPGDFFYGDESGAIIIPQELFNNVMIETSNIKNKENKIIKMLKEGKPLSKISGVRKD